MKKKQWLRILSLCLSVLLCMQLGTHIVFAEDTAQTTEETSASPTQPQLVGELTKKRTASEKYFIYDDQSVVAAVYPQAVHYQDEQDTWQEVDNRLTQTGQGDNAELENAQNAWKIKLAKKAKDGKLVTLKYQNHNIKWHLSGAQKTQGKAYETTGSSATDELHLPNVNSGMIYEQILPHIDLEYLLSGDRIKENIILNDPAAIGEYTFIYQTGKLVMTKEGDCLLLSEGDTPLLTITAPVMTDAAGAQSTAIELSFQELKATGGNHMYAVTVSPDARWLKEEGRLFPVKIDPTTSTELNNQKIFETYVSKKDPTTNYNAANHVTVGMNGSSEVYRTYIKFSLPTNIGTSDRIIGAYLNLHPDPIISVDDWDEMATHLPVIEAHAPTEYWNHSTLTWNTQPAWSSIVLDYDIIQAESSTSAYRMYSWDITTLVDDWYTTGNNHGVMLKYNSEDAYYGNKIAKFCSALRTGFTDNTAVYPVIHFRYINMSGLEDYWTYHTLDAGAAGTAYINDFTGNLTIVTPMASVASAIMPLDVSLVYAPDSNNSSINKLNVGHNFMLNVQSYIKKEEINSQTRYKFVDGDGTVHYFENVNGVWKDDGGFGWTLTVGTSTLSIKDKQDNVTRFSTSGRISKYIDNCGNEREYKYDSSGYLTEITNGTHSITIERDWANRLQKLWYPDSDGNRRYAQITYNDNDTIYHLTQYALKDGVYKPTDVVNFSTADGTRVIRHIVSCPYDEANPPENSASLIHGSALTFMYNTVEESPVLRRRITSYKKRVYKGGGSFGATEYEVSISYQNRATKYTMTPPDGSGQRTELYTFDTMGRTITAQDQDGNAVFSQYGLEGGAQNKVTFSSGSQRVVTNWAKNHNFEKSTSTDLVDWVHYGNTNDNAAIKGTAEGEPLYIGSQALKVYKHNASQTKTSHGAQHLYVEGGKKYTLSVYVRTDFESVANVAGAGAQIGLQNLDIPFTTYQHAIISDGKFTRYHVTADLTGISGTCLLTIVLGVNRARGVAYFDGVQLEEGSVVNSYNLVENFGFENTSDTVFWKEENTGDVDGVILSTVHTGSASFKFTGNPKVAKRIYQTIQISGKAGSSFTAGAWVKTYTVPDKDTNQDGARQTCAITLEFCQTNGSSYYVTATLPSANGNWRYICLDAVAKKDFTSVKLYLKYPYNCNVTYFDDVCLFGDTLGQSYTYDANGNVATVVNLAKNTEYVTHNGNNDLTTYKDGNSNTYTFEYDNGDTSVKKHLLTKTINPISKETTYTYNSYGNPTRVNTKSVGGMLMRSDTAYTDNGHFVKSQTDTSGITVENVVDSSTGRINKVYEPTSETGQERLTTYIYDDLTKALTDVSVGTETNRQNYVSNSVSVSYDYKSGKLVEINRNAEDTKQMGYHFLYDAHDRNTAVEMSGRSGATYLLQQTAYYDYISLPKTVTYGNGQQVGYEYTRTGQLKTRSYNGTAIEGYEYNAKNALGYSWYQSNSQNKKIGTHFIYDLAGRISSSKNDLGLSTSSYTYDKNNNLTAYDSALQDNHMVSGYSTHYAYNALNSLTRLHITPTNGNDSGTTQYTYDGLGRMNAKKVSLNSTDNNLTTTYTYKTRTVDDNVTMRTYQPSTTHMQGTYNNTTIDLKYYTLYAPDGNLSRIRVTENGVHDYTHYVYDDLGQLTKWKNTGIWAYLTSDAVDEYNYTYDEGGNLLTKEHKLGTAVDYTATYTYDSNLTDQLTWYTKHSSDGTVTANTYDYTAANGSTFVNPTTITKITWLEDSTITDTWNLTWEQGRQLSSITSAAGTTSYEYNENGLRTYKKQADGTTHYYYYNGTQLEYIKITDAAGNLTCTLRYIYNSTGQAEYVLYLSAANAATPKKFDMYYIHRDSEGKIHRLIQVRSVYNSTVTATLENTVEYVYDPFGKLLEVKCPSGDPIGQYNPLIYKDYIYDFETGFYYVSSRYYDPEIGRFINADAVIGQIGNVQGTNMFAYCFNNPVNMSDPTGNWPKLSTIFTVVAVAAVAVAAVAVTVATCGAAAPALAVAGGGIIGGISAGAAATAASVATGAMIVAGVSTAAAVTSAAAEKAVEKTAKRNNSVYVLKDDAGTVQYVGRTNNVDKRRTAHSANPARAGLEMEVIASGLNLPESRALEQAGMAYYHTINTANKMNNQINSVSPKYWGAFKELALGTLNYGWNQMSNEILYWTGN